MPRPRLSKPAAPSINELFSMLGYLTWLRAEITRTFEAAGIHRSDSTKTAALASAADRGTTTPGADDVSGQRNTKPAKGRRKATPRQRSRKESSS